FKGLAKDYFKLYPSVFKSITSVGLHFPKFLSENKITENYPYLADLAKIEWMHVRSFHFRQYRPMNPESLNGVSQEKIASSQLLVDPSASLLDLSFDLKQKYERPEDDIEVKEEPNVVLVYEENGW